MRNTIAAIVLVVLVVAGGLYIFHGKHAAPLPAVPGYENATYTIEGQPVTLVNGAFAAPAAPGSASTDTTEYFGDAATGDLNGDGTPDAAFILTQTTGGSGTFYYAVAALKTSSGYAGTNGILLGDRIAPQSVSIADGEVVVNYADRNATDAMTVAPSVGVTKYLEVSGNRLVEVSDPASYPTVYVNTDYGFTFSLPADWKGYSIVPGTWEGTPLAATPAITGPQLLIRNPNWTASDHYEDIPVLVFTIAQWNSYTAGDFAVSAAPINASEIARNDTYVFALPPRWDYDYSQGYQEADTIVAAKTLVPFDL